MSIVLPTEIMLELFKHYINILIEETGTLTAKECESIKQGVFAWPDYHDRTLSMQAAVRNLKIALPAWRQVIQGLMWKALEDRRREYEDFDKKYEKRHNCVVVRGFSWKSESLGIKEDTTGLLTRELRYRLMHRMYTGAVFTDIARVEAERLRQSGGCTCTLLPKDELQRLSYSLYSFIGLWSIDHES